MRVDAYQMERPVRRLRLLEQHDRRAAPGGTTPRALEGPPRWRAPTRLCRPNRTEHAAGPPANRECRAGPCLWRRVCSGLGDPGWRRPGDREIDLAVAGRGSDRIAFGR